LTLATLCALLIAVLVGASEPPFEAGYPYGATSATPTPASRTRGTSESWNRRSCSDGSRARATIGSSCYYDAYTSPNAADDLTMYQTGLNNPSPWGATYFYSVTAVDAAGNVSAPSSIASVIVR
jgi:hypothetical protein